MTRDSLLTIKNVILEIIGFCLPEDYMPTDEGLEVVTKFKTPQSNILPRSFLGLFNFSIKFTPQFSTVTALLHMLMKNNAPFLWVKKYV
jgi:hypothetical protein